MMEIFWKVTNHEETSCQNNCEQPTFGKSNGDIRKRVVGYCEAWVHLRSCNDMSIDQIPVGDLTHLILSFAYITPGTFEIVLMDDLDHKLLPR